MNINLKGEAGEKKQLKIAFSVNVVFNNLSLPCFGFAFMFLLYLPVCDITPNVMNVHLELQNKGCVGVDDHNRRLCSNFNMNRCQAAANGAECQRGFHLCMKIGCHAPHSAFDHEKDKGNKPGRLQRVVDLTASGANIAECFIVEIFCVTSRVTACLKQLGLKGCFGVDKLHSKNAMSSVIIADLTTPEGKKLLMSWLQDANVLGIFLAPPCRSASRARQPRPLRSDQFPNGLYNLTPSELGRVFLANQLYHLTAKVVKWAVEVGCIFVVENPQCSFFWATAFWTEVSHLAMHSVFHSCQFFIAFNAAEFLATSAQCPGQSSKHKHARWGLNRHTNTFATSGETAYPMGLARLIAVVFTRIFLNNGIASLPDTLEQVQDCSLQSLQRNACSN